MKTAHITAELTVLNTVLAIYRAKIEAAWDVAADAEEAFKTAKGFLPWESIDANIYPEGRAWSVAKEAERVLNHDNGFYWATSRLWDLERAQRMDVSSEERAAYLAARPAHPHVTAFIADVLGYSTAMAA